MALREIFGEIKRRIKLSEYLTNVFGVEVKGGFARCVFHDDKTPSLHIIGDERAYCFSCGEGFDIFDLLVKKHNLPLMEAVRRLAGELGLKMSPEEEERIQRYRDLQVRTDKMLGQARTDLCDDMVGQAYLEGRGMTAAAVAHFGYGYRPDKHAITIPIHDAYQRLVGCALRMLDPQAKPKYVNSVEDEYGLFKKREVLYNLGAARKHVKDRVFVAEGYLDVASLWLLGHQNSVGILNAVMTKEQGKILHEAILPTTEIVLVMDWDKAGREALAKNLALLRAYAKDRSIRVVRFDGAKADGTPVKDANDAMLANAERAKMKVASAVQAERVLLELLLAAEPEPARQYQLAWPVVMSVTPLLRDDLMTFLAKTWGKEKKLLHELFGSQPLELDGSTYADTFDRIDAYAEYAEHLDTKGIKLKFHGLDRYIRRISPGEVIYVQARPAVGKTALAVNLLAALGQQHHTCLFFSLEMQKEQIFQREMQVANNLSGEEVELLTKSKFRAQLGDAHARFHEMFRNVYVVDRPGLTFPQIREHVARFAAIHKPPQVVAVDYFGYIKADVEDEYARLSRLAVEIKEAAKSLNNQWLILHQLSRVGGNGGEPVTLDMGRGSGVQEESADIVIGAWRPELAKDISDEERELRYQESAMMVSVLKNRNGPTGVSKMRFNRRTLIIDDFDTPGRLAEAPAPQLALNGFTEEPK